MAGILEILFASLLEAGETARKQQQTQSQNPSEPEPYDGDYKFGYSQGYDDDYNAPYSGDLYEYEVPYDQQGEDESRD